MPTEKLCGKCAQTLPASEFYKRASATTGLTSWCKPCTRKAKQESNSRVRNSDPGSWAERRAGYAKAYRQRHSVKIADADRRRDLQRRYQISVDAYETMLSTQNGSCAICHEPPRTKALAVDHDHATGEVRGLLCSACNLAVGHLRDRADLAIATANYLSK